MPRMQPWTTIAPAMPSAAEHHAQPFPASPQTYEHPHVRMTCAAEQHVQWQDGNWDNRALRAISESIDALTERIKAIEGQVSHPPSPWTPRGSRHDDGRPQCHYCKRVGHIARHCHNRYRDQEEECLGRQGMQGEPRNSDSGNRNGRV